ncbi:MULTISPECIES: MFS transporter [unclassified Leifsonia]|uniref:MFS transporter n=1 Tax=unclassified Leifsonia TaxID=2663824 RepID=UPI000A949AAF|nr:MULTISPECIES: MFS transporter [unclassified Leifsonia]
MSTTDSAAVSSTSKFPWLGLMVLAVAVFLSVTGEMLPTGLLPDMSRDLGVSEPLVGLLVTVFAFTVVLTSAPLTGLTRRLPRHALLVAAIVVLGLANVLTALAPSYGFVVGSRVVGGMAHGLFWAIVGAYAGHLVPKEQIGRAVSIALGGGTLAFVFGVPLGTALGHAVGWRLAFGIVAGLTLLSALLVWRFLPVVHRVEPGVNTAAIPAIRDRSVMAVAIVCAVTAITMIGHYVLYTYIAPYFIEVVGTDAAAISPLLFVAGVSGLIGLVVAGSVFSKLPTRGLLVALGVVALSVSALGLFSGSWIPALIAFIVWSLAFGMLPPLLQTRLLHAASARIRDAASAFYTTAFNVGIGGGALLGAVLYDTLGLAALPWVYAGIVVVAFVVVAVTSGRHRPQGAEHVEGGGSQATITS